MAAADHLSRGWALEEAGAGYWTPAEEVAVADVGGDQRRETPN